MKITSNWIFIKNLSKRRAEHMGAVWNDYMGAYRLPKTIGVLHELHLMKYPVKELLEKQKFNRTALINLKRLQDAPGEPRLRPYQRVDVNYLKGLKAAGIFNEMRTGKTPTSLVLLQELGIQKGIIVVPAGLILNWEKEVKQWTQLEPISSLGSKQKRIKTYTSWLKDKDLLIISYETLRNDLIDLVAMLKKSKTDLDSLLVDEAHRLRSLAKGKKASLVSKAVRDLGRLAKRRYALTGTPVVKEGQEVWGILHFLYPDRFPGYWQFLDRYFEIGSNGFGQEVKGYKRKKELQEILSIISTNRKRHEVMKWLPKKQYQTIELEMNSKQKKVYKDVLETFEYEDVIDAPNHLAQLIRLRQITTMPNLMVDKVQNEKEKFLIEWLNDHEQESVLVFSSFSSYLKELNKKIKGSRLIIGDMTKAERTKTEELFQAGKCKVILANIKAAGVGLTLDKAETVIFLDREYNPSDNEQAEDRIVPTKEENNHSMHVINLVMKDSVDEIINGLLKHKVDVTKVINNGGIEALERMWRELDG